MARRPIPARARAAVARLAANTAERERRPELILAARRAGATWPAIAEAAGVTEFYAQQLARQANGGTLPPIDPLTRRETK